MATIGTSVLASVIAAVIIFGIASLWRGLLWPRIEDKIYQGIRVDGTWSIHDKTDNKGGSLYSQVETLELEQKASRLSGRLILVPKDDDTLKTRTLVIDGVVRDRFVIITCVPVTRRDLGFQVFLGEVSGDGTEIRGQATYYHIRQGTVQSIEATYIK